ncbi:MAG: NAD(+) synthase, partial [Candidatus Diapherotrites archaeon]
SVPKRILKKKPSAGFWKGQTDEGELGASYGQIDKLLIQLESKNRKVIEGRKKLPAYARKICLLIKKNEHKKKRPVVIR